MWVPTSDLPIAPSRPFYGLNRLLQEHNFDPFVARLCARFFVPRIRSS